MMKTNFRTGKLLCILIAAAIILGSFAGCSGSGGSDAEKNAQVSGKFVGGGEKDNEPLKEADDTWKEDSLSEDTTDANESQGKKKFSDEEVSAYVKSALGSKYEWSGDYKKLTDEQKEKIEKQFYDDGYTVKVTDTGITYLSYTPKLKKDEVRDIINETLSTDQKEYKWSGKYSDLTDKQKREVTKAIQEKGIDAAVTDDGIYYSSDHKNDVAVSDDIMPITGEPSVAVVQAALNEISDKYSKWDGDYSKLNLSEKDKQELINRLKEIGFNVTFLKDGPIYLGGDVNGEQETSDVAVKAVSLSQTSAYIAVGGTVTLKAVISPSNATNRSVTWQSSNEDIAKVTTTGTVRGYAAGKTVITVTTADGGYKAECALTVLAQSVAVKSVSLSQSSASLGVGETLQLTPSIKPDNATNTAVKWSSSDSKVASVSDSGLVSAKKAGEAVITVTTSDGSKTDTCSVKVTSSIKGVSKTFGFTFGGTNYDKFDDVEPTSDGGCIVMGNFSSANEDYAVKNEGTGQKMSLIKFNKNGEKQWIQVVGGDEEVTFYDAAVLTDGSIVAVGTTMSKTTYPACQANNSLKAGTVDALFIKYSSDGKLQWFKTLRGSKGEYFESVAATPDGGFVAGGKTESSDGDFEGLDADIIKAMIIKYNAAGEPQWKRAYNGSKHSTIPAIDVNASGFIYLSCITASSDGDFENIAGKGAYDTIIMKYSKNGDRQWFKSVSGTGNDSYEDIACTGDGGCVAVGGFSVRNNVGTDFLEGVTSKGSTDAAIIKLSSDGKLDWFKTFGGSNADSFAGVDAVNGGYVVTGTTGSSDSSFSSLGNKGEEDAFVMMLNASGSMVNINAINGKQQDVARAVCASEDRLSFSVVGYTRSNDNSFKDMKAPGKGKFISFMFGYEIAK